MPQKPAKNPKTFPLGHRGPALLGHTLEKRYTYPPDYKGLKFTCIKVVTAWPPRPYAPEGLVVEVHTKSKHESFYIHTTDERAAIEIAKKEFVERMERMAEADRKMASGELMREWYASHKKRAARQKVIDKLKEVRKHDLRSLR